MEDPAQLIKYIYLEVEHNIIINIEQALLWQRWMLQPILRNSCKRLWIEDILNIALLYLKPLVFLGEKTKGIWFEKVLTD